MENIYLECHKKLMELSRKIIDKSKCNISKQGFAWNQFKVMKSINPGESLTLSQISERASKKNSNITQIIDYLEERGIVRRRPDDRDRRVIRVELTKEGEKIREQVIKYHEEFVQSMYHSLTDSEIKSFLELAEVFLERIK